MTVRFLEQSQDAILRDAFQDLLQCVCLQWVRTWNLRAAPPEAVLGCCMRAMNAHVIVQRLQYEHER